MNNKRELPIRKFIPLLKELNIHAPAIRYSPPDEPNKSVSFPDLLRSIKRTYKPGYRLEVSSAEIPGYQYNPIQRILDGGISRLTAFAKKSDTPLIKKINIRYHKPADAAYVDAMSRFGSH